MSVQPYLFFDGRCDEALAFYRKALNAEVVQLMRFKESPDQGGCGDGPTPPEDKVMHAMFKVGGSEVMASDGRCEGKPTFAGFSLTLGVKSVADAEQRFAALAEGGRVQMPLEKTFWSERFGMVADRFGVSWMVMVVPQ